jgi:hypothetical protein
MHPLVEEPLLCIEFFVLGYYNEAPCSHQWQLIESKYEKWVRSSKVTMNLDKPRLALAWRGVLDALAAMLVLSWELVQGQCSWGRGCFWWTVLRQLSLILGLSPFVVSSKAKLSCLRDSFFKVSQVSVQWYTTPFARWIGSSFASRKWE